MKESTYKSYEELPLFLNAATVAKVLGIAPSSSYELMHEKDFPALRDDGYDEGWLQTQWQPAVHNPTDSSGAPAGL